MSEPSLQHASILPIDLSGASSGTSTSLSSSLATGASGAGPSIGIVFGSTSDWPTMRLAVETCDSFGIAVEYGVVSAHRTPDRLRDYAMGAAARGVQVIIAGAGGAAHLPGMLAAWTTLPVFGVPIQSRALSGVDSLLSIAQMPKGVPVGTLAIGEAGAQNAALLALRMLSVHNPSLRDALAAFAQKKGEDALAAPLEP